MEVSFNWWYWFQEGWIHILDWQAYDHMIFLMALVAGYSLGKWREVLGLITAFTIGHALTLCLSALGILTFPSYYVELLIPITILLTVLFKAFAKKEGTNERTFNIGWEYLLVLVFGWIHGMGFSGQFKSLFGQQQEIFMPLFGFNTGIEIGQLVFILGFLFLGEFLYRFTPITERKWEIFLLILAGITSIFLLIPRF